MKVKLSTRDLFQPTSSELSPDSPFSALVDYWLADIDLEGRLAPSTRRLYERDMRTLVMPAFGNLTLREIGVARRPRCRGCVTSTRHRPKPRTGQARGRGGSVAP